MTRRSFLADDAKRRVVLADIPKRHVDPNHVAGALGAAEAVTAPPGGGSPVHWHAVRKDLSAESRDQSRCAATDSRTATGTRR